jgi:hemoglobin
MDWCAPNAYVASFAFACSLRERSVYWRFSHMASRDISTAEDVRTLVDSFYSKVTRDELLGPIFNDVAQVEWATHLPVMYRFWEWMLLGAGIYQGAPFPKHAVLPVQKEHFARWLTLFMESVDAHFCGPKAAEAKGRAASIADTFAQRMGLLKDVYGLGIPLSTAGAPPDAC